MKKLLSITLTVLMMLSCIALTASAAGLTMDVIDYTAKTAGVPNATAADLGAEATYGLKIVDADGYTVAVADMYTTDYLGLGKFNLRNVQFEEGKVYNLPYVTYKFSAGSGKVINTLSVDIAAHLRDYANNCYYQLAVYVSRKPLTADGSGAVDFSKLTPVKIFGGDENTAASDLERKSGFVNLNLTDAVAALSESQNIYVTLAFNQSWTSSTPVKDGDTVVSLSNVDNSRERLFKIKGTATEKAASDEPEKTPETADVMAVSAVLFTAACAGAVLTLRKKHF